MVQMTPAVRLGHHDRPAQYPARSPGNLGDHREQGGARDPLVGPGPRQWRGREGQRPVVRGYRRHIFLVRRLQRLPPRRRQRADRGPGASAAERQHPAPIGIRDPERLRKLQLHRGPRRPDPHRSRMGPAERRGREHAIARQAGQADARRPPEGGRSLRARLRRDRGRRPFRPHSHL